MVTGRLLGAGILTTAMAMVGLAAGPGTAAPPAQSATAPTPDISPHPPAPPGDLAVTRVTATSVTLTWTTSARGCCAIDGYDISIAPAFNDVLMLVSVGDVTTTTITSGIHPGTQYTFRVSARDVVGHHSGWSAPVTVVTRLPTAVPTSRRPPPRPGWRSPRPARPAPR
jgi:cellulose 1,4-beta-cellobiosidase